MSLSAVAGVGYERSLTRPDVSEREHGAPVPGVLGTVLCGVNASNPDASRSETPGLPDPKGSGR